MGPTSTKEQPGEVSAVIWAGDRRSTDDMDWACIRLSASCRTANIAGSRYDVKALGYRAVAAYHVSGGVVTDVSLTFASWENA